jgi:hypothetical protein
MSRFRGIFALDESWEETRARGRRDFIWRQGMLRFALPVGVLYNLLLIVYEVGFQPLQLEQYPEVALRRLAVSLVVWPLAGWFVAAHQWRDNERRRERQGRMNVP